MSWTGSLKDKQVTTSILWRPQHCAADVGSKPWACAGRALGGFAVPRACHMSTDIILKPPGEARGQFLRLEKF